MDIVYASLVRREAEGSPRDGEAAEVVGALWAHAAPEDGIEHASVRVLVEQVVILFFLHRAARTGGSPEGRVARLLDRCHRASPLLRSRYLPPA
ncbi:hypothetical protein ABT095_23725 [Kitasatospora sp. NPDC002227]|uniref:hypothetical protein n=1 Tax=Kitasatospora sp. NPDC002227 TaxID=3154773 RepID=UPI00331915EC